jgi:hypothetical protein
MMILIIGSLVANLDVSPAHIGDITVSKWGSGSMTFDLSLGVPFLGTIGTIHITLSPSVDGTVPPEPLQSTSWLLLHVCESYDANIAAAIVDTIVAALVGAAVGGIAGGAIGAAIAFAVVASISIVATTQADLAIGDTVDTRFGSASLANCSGPDKTGCRNCRQEVNEYVSQVGYLRLQGVTVEDDGTLQLTGLVAPRVDNSAIPQLDLQMVGKWHDLVDPCGTSGDAGNHAHAVLIHNAGGLPLIICTIDQELEVTKQHPSPVELLQFRVGAASSHGAPVITPIVIPGNGYFGMTVVMRDPHNKAVYDPRHPIPLILRVTSNGGAQTLDLNSQDKAGVIDPSQPALNSKVAQLLCGVLPIPTQILGVPWFVDPVPFTNADRVRERVDTVVDVSAGTTVSLANETGVVVARVTSAGKEVPLRATIARGRAVEHVTLGLQLQFSQDAGSHPVRSFSRSLYRETAWLPMQVLDAAPIGREVAVLTGSELLIGDVQIGGIRWSTRIAEPGLTLARFGRHLAVAGTEDVRIYTAHLQQVAAIKVAAERLAARGDKLYLVSRGTLLVARAHGADVQLSRWAMGRVRDVVATRAGVFAATADGVWELGEAPRRIHSESGRLVALDGRPALRSTTGITVLEGDHGWSLQDPFLATLIEWPDVAIELRSGVGLVVHERLATSVEVTRGERLLARSLPPL